MVISIRPQRLSRRIDSNEALANHQTQETAADICYFLRSPACRVEFSYVTSAVSPFIILLFHAR